MASESIKLPPLALYVHIPWCIKKCPYCDFNSHSVHGDAIPEQQYLEALERDLQQSAHQAQGRLIQSIFFGGGTPSLFSAESIARILHMAKSQIGLSEQCEITLEANPGTFEQERFCGYRQAAVNRLSIGIQSFEQTKLQALGRIHSADEALNALSIAREAGFDNINLDLMYGLPDQSEDQAIEDLQQAILLKPEHISWYELTIEPNTEFFNQPPAQPSLDQLADYSDRGIQLLAQSGYKRYETSAFAQITSADSLTATISRHNLNYWQFGDYIGIGAGAHGKYTNIQGDIVRQSKTRLPKHYMARIGSYVASEHSIPTEEVLAEYMMNALRLIEGVELADASLRTGLTTDRIISACQLNIDLGLMDIADNRLKPTEQGQRLLNLCLQNFL